MEKKKVRRNEAGQVTAEMKRRKQTYEQEMSVLMQAHYDRLRHHTIAAKVVAQAEADVLSRQEDTRNQDPVVVLYQRQKQRSASPRNNPAMLSDAKNRLIGKSTSRFSLPEKDTPSRNELKNTVVDNIFTSVSRQAVRITRSKPKLERVIDDESKALSTNQTTYKSKKSDTNRSRAQSCREEVSGLREISPKQPLLANASGMMTTSADVAKVAVIHPQNVPKTCQQPNKTQQHAQSLGNSNSTEQCVQDQNNVGTEMEKVSQEDRTHDTERRLDDEQPQKEKHTATQISRHGIETCSQANGVATQNISVNKPQYPGMVTFDRPLRTSSLNVPEMPITGEIILQSSIHNQTIYTHHTCETRTDTLDAVYGYPFKIVPPDNRLGNKNSIQHSENDESSCVILSGYPNNSTTNTTVIICPFCSKCIYLSYPASNDSQAHTDTITNSPEGKDTRNIVKDTSNTASAPENSQPLSESFTTQRDQETAANGTESQEHEPENVTAIAGEQPEKPCRALEALTENKTSKATEQLGSEISTPRAADGRTKRNTTVRVTSHETSPTDIQVAIHKPQCGANMTNTVNSNGNKCMHPETQRKYSENLVENNNHYVKLLLPTTTPGEKPQTSSGSTETARARPTKADSKNCSTKTDAVPEDYTCTSNIAAKGGVIDDDQQAKEKAIKPTSATSPVLHEHVIVSELLTRVACGGHTKNILSKIGVEITMSALVQEAFVHLKECEICSVSLGELIEKLDEKIVKTSSMRENSPAIASPGPASGDLLLDDSSKCDVSGTSPTGQVDGECVLEPYVERFQFTKEELDKVYPEHVARLAAMDMSPYSGGSSPATGRETDTRVPRSRSRSSSMTVQTDANSEECPSETWSTRTIVEHELSDNKTSQARVEVFDESTEPSQQCDPSPVDLAGDVGTLQTFRDSPRTSSPTKSRLECSIAEDRRRVIVLYDGEGVQVRDIVQSTTEISCEARNVGGSTASSDRIPGDHAAVPDGDRDAISETSREVCCSDITTIKAPVLSPATTSSASMSPRSGQEERTSEEPVDSGGHAVHTAAAEPVPLERTLTTEEKMEEMQAAANLLSAWSQETHNVITKVTDDSRRRQQKGKMAQGVSQYTVHEVYPFKILKEADRGTVPRDLNLLILDNTIVVGWEKSDLPNCRVVGFEIHVNSELNQEIRNTSRTRAIITHVDLSKKVVIVVYAITPRGRIHNPARLTLLPSK